MPHSSQPMLVHCSCVVPDDCTCRCVYGRTQEPTTPVIKAIGIHRLSEQSHGNGGGMALADIVSKKFFDALDLQLTWKHMISCNWTVGGKIPVRCECCRPANYLVQLQGGEKWPWQLFCCSEPTSDKTLLVFESTTSLNEEGLPKLDPLKIGLLRLCRCVLGQMPKFISHVRVPLVSAT